MQYALTLKELNGNSQSLITIKDFESEADKEDSKNFICIFLN